MPLYTFGCKNCGRVLDEFAPVDGPWPDCPNCGGALAKRITIPQVVVPDYHKAVNHASNQRHKAWMESEPIKAGLRSGDLEIRKNDD